MTLLFGLMLGIAFRIKCWLGGENDLWCRLTNSKLLVNQSSLLPLFSQ